MQEVEKKGKIKVNKLPIKTWNWLQVNDSRLNLHELKNEECEKNYGLTAEGIIYDNTERLKEIEIETGMNIDLASLCPDINIKTDSIYVKPGSEIKKVLKMNFKYGGSKETINNIEIYAGENSKVTVIMEYESNNEDKGKAIIQTKLYAGRNAEINLIQVQLLGDNFLNLNNIGGRCEESSTINIKQIILGGRDRYYGCRVDLAGDNSMMDSEISYLGKDTQNLDMNYLVNHRGKKTESKINVLGTLQDKACKLFRGTIDFKRGAAGSKGKENENVLLIGEDIRNKTIPLILCKEEDVEGSHGASIGRIDDELLFYLAARGLDLQAAYQLLEKSRIDSLCRKINNQDVSRKVADFMGRGEALNE